MFVLSHSAYPEVCDSKWPVSESSVVVFVGMGSLLMNQAGKAFGLIGT